MAIFTAAAAIGASVFSAIGVTATFATGVTFATVAVGFLAQAAIGLALNALTPKPKTQGANRGYQVNSRGSALDHQIIYGRMRVGGVLAFEATSDFNGHLHQAFIHAGHPVESYDEVYIDNRKVTRWLRISDDAVVTEVTVNDGEQYAPYEDALIDVFGNVVPGSLRRWYVDATNPSFIWATFRFYDGTQNVSDPLLKSKFPGIWTDRHQLNGLAYMAVTWIFNAEVYPNGVPDTTAVIKGKKVYDPRTDSTSWSDNPALCVRDYLTSGYGLSESVGNIDDEIFSTAADVCDRVDTPDGSKRYTCNGSFVTSLTPYDVLSEMITSMGGLIWYAQGKWRVKPAYWVPPTITFTEDDLRSSIAVKTRHSRRDNFNTVRGTFRGQETGWQVSEYPEVTNPDFISADNGQESVVDFDLPFTDNSSEARRIANILLERNRQQLTVAASFGLRAFQVQVGDVVNLTVSRFGWSDKAFEVTSWTFGLTDAQDLQVQMTLREISESVFDDISDGVIYEADNTVLESALLAPAVGISLSNSVEILYENARNVITATVTGSSPQIDYVEVQFKNNSSSNWVSVGYGELGDYRIEDLLDGNYDVRARSVNSLGVKGAWTQRLNFPARGLATPPQQVQGFSAEVNGATVNLEWEPVSDLDLSYYRIRYTPETTGVAWNLGIDYVDKVAKPATSVSVPARAGTYMIKAVDQGGRESTAFTSVVVNTSDLESFATTLTQTEDPTFSGVKDGTTVTSGELRISEAILFDSLSGNIDSLSGQWDDLGLGDDGGLLGTYEFSDVIDIGSVKRARVRVDAYQSRFDSSANLFDNIIGTLDSNPSNWDDLTDNPDLGDTNVIAYVSTTNDDPTGTPTWTDYKKLRVADISARAFRFKVELSAPSVSTTPSISELDAVVQHN